MSMSDEMSWLHQHAASLQEMHTGFEGLTEAVYLPQDALSVARPAFSLLTICDIIPASAKDGYADAEGALV